jgi:uncharacterized DUF497 family protein
MRITFDHAKRVTVREERQLDLADAGQVFEGFHLTRSDDAHSDHEERFKTVGDLNDVVVLIIWTIREDSRRIITMWKANEKERAAYHRRREQSG